MSTVPLVSVVIINHQRKDLLRRCVRSVLALEYPNLEVIVVDNASDDGSAEMVEAEFGDEVRVIRRTENSVTAARNDGYRAARGEVFLSLDNDIVFPDPTVLARALALFERFPTVGMLSFLVGTEEEPREPLPEHWWYEVPIEEGKARTFFTSYYSEGAVLIRRELFESTGGYDEDFFRCAENLDVILKSFRDGWEMLFSSDLFCAELAVRGFLGSRRTQRNYLTLRNKLWVVWKHYPLVRGLRWGAARIGMALLRSLRHGWPDLFLRGVFRGVFAPKVIRRKRAPLPREAWQRLAAVRPVRYVDPTPVEEGAAAGARGERS